MASEVDTAQESVVLASFENRRAAEHMLASLGRGFRKKASKGSATALVVTANKDGSLKLTQSRVLTGSGFASALLRLSVSWTVGFMGMVSTLKGAKGGRQAVHEREAHVGSEEQAAHAILAKAGPNAALALVCCKDSETRHAVAAQAADRASYSWDGSRTEFLADLDPGPEHDWVREAYRARWWRRPSCLERSVLAVTDRSPRRGDEGLAGGPENVQMLRCPRARGWWMAALLAPTLAAALAAPAWGAPVSRRVVSRLLHVAPSMSARRARRELQYLDRQYARTEPSLVSWHVGDCRRRSRTADNCRERDRWGPGSNGMTVPNVCFTRVALQTTREALVEFTFGPTTCYSLVRSQPQAVVFGLPPHPTAKVTQPFGIVGKLRERHG
jgi:hypothetical protein